MSVSEYGSRRGGGEARDEMIRIDDNYRTHTPDTRLIHRHNNNKVSTRSNTTSWGPRITLIHFKNDFKI